MSADICGRDAEIEVFFDGLPQDVLYAAYRGLDAMLRPMAYVSEQLMVLRQTHSCAALLAYGGFYSLREVLDPAACDAIQNSVRTGTAHTILLSLSGERWSMRIVPAEGQALLVFQCDVQHQVGVSMTAAGLRGSAAAWAMRSAPP